MGHLLTEITDQPNVLMRTMHGFLDNKGPVDDLVKRFQSGQFEKIILTGMGASYYCCYPLWLRLINLGLPISLWDTSELVNFAPKVINDKTLIIAVSQSGESVEIKRLVDLSNKPACILGISNSLDNFLSSKVDLVLDLNAGEEYSVSSKTYSASLLLLHLFGCVLIGMDLEIEAKKIERVTDHMQCLINDLPYLNEQITGLINYNDHLAILGRGYSLSSANYGALIIEEAAKKPVISLSTAQFRHGPMELVRNGFCAVLLGGSKNVWETNHRFINDFCSLGGKLLLISPEKESVTNNNVQCLNIPLVEDELLPILEVVPLQQLVISLASSQGFDPGIFTNSGKVTKIE